MDSLKSGFKKLFSKSSFQGEPHVLGNAPSDEGKKPKPSSSTHSSQRPFSGQPHKLGTRPAPAAPSPAAPARPPPAPLPRPPPRDAPGSTSGNSSGALATARPVPPAVESSVPQLFHDVEPVVSEALHIAVAVLCSSGEGAAAALTLLAQILTNLRREPSNPKFAKLRVGNAKIGALLARPGAADVLAHAGFEAHTADGDVFWEVQRPLEVLPRVAGALQTVSQALATQFDSGPAAPPAAAAASQDSARPTQPVDCTDIPRIDADGVDVPEAPLAPEDAIHPDEPQTNSHPGLQVSEASTTALRNTAQQACDASAEATLEKEHAQDNVTSRRVDTAPTAPLSTSTGSQGQELGMSPEEWKAQVGKTSAAAVAQSVGLAPQELGISKEEWVARERAKQASTAAAAPPEPFTGRNTQVLLPTRTDVALPDWFFARTPAEVHRDYVHARKKHEQERQLMTRAMREQLAAKGRRKYVFATIRVRFPEGYLLQGDFHQDEPVTNIFAWVTFALREPLPFRLTSPALPGKQKNLTAEGTVRSVQLMPSFLFNFQWDEPTRMGVSVPCLSDDALLDAKLQNDV